MHLWLQRALQDFRETMVSERISASTIEYIHKWEILTKVEVVMYFQVITLLKLAFTICS